MTALWTEACLTFPTLDALKEGYEVYPVVDAVGGTSLLAHKAALKRMEQAGAKLTSNVQLLCELQRDWKPYSRSSRAQVNNPLPVRIMQIFFPHGKLFDGVSFIDPIDFYVVLKVEESLVGEFHLVQQGEGGPYIGTMFKGATPAINDNIRVSGQTIELLFEPGKFSAVFGGTYVDGTFDESAGTDAEDDGLFCCRIVDGFGQVYGGFQLCRRPGFIVIYLSVERRRYGGEKGDGQ